MSRIYNFENDLGNDKRKNVLTSFGINGKHGNVIFVIDDTMFGSCKDGVVITENYLIAKSAFQAPVYYEFKFCEGLICTNKKLILNNYTLYDFSIPDASELKLFFEKINNDYFIKPKKNIDKVELSNNKPKDLSVKPIEKLPNENELVAHTKIAGFAASENKLIGKVFVQAPYFEVGKSSYHFDSEDNVYINFEKWGKSNYPLVKKFTNTKFDLVNRVFIGLIDWTDFNEGEFLGDNYWLYLMVFNNDYSKIEGGNVVFNKTNGAHNFPDDLKYFSSDSKDIDELKKITNIILNSPPKNSSLFLKKHEIDKLFYLIESNNSGNNKGFIEQLSESSNEKIKRSFQEYIVKCILHFRKEFVINGEFFEFKNDIATIEVCGGIISIALLKMYQKGIDRKVGFRIAQEGIRALLGLKSDLESDPVASAFFVIINDMFNQKDDDYDTGDFARKIAFRLIVGNMSGSIIDCFDEDNIDNKYIDQIGILFDEEGSKFMDSLTGFFNKVDDEVNSLLNKIQH